MATTLPDDTTKADFDAGSDDPKQARVEFATNADIQNELKEALGDFAQFNNQADSGLETVGQSGGTPDDIQVKLDGTSIKRGTNGVAVDAPHERKTVDYLAVAADRGNLIEMDKATAIVLNLTAAATLGEGWFVYVKNSGIGLLTIDPDSTETIDDATTIALHQNQSAIIFCDGGNFWTVGQSSTILQSISTVVSAASGTTAFPDDNTAPTSSEGSEIWTDDITPADNTNKVRITGAINCNNNGGRWNVSALFRGTTCIAVFALRDNLADIGDVMPINHEDSPASASAVTYSIRHGCHTGTDTWRVGQREVARYNGLMAQNMITLEEIVAS